MISIVGGTYHERCLEPLWEETYGSGLRACKAIMSLDSEVQIEYYTFLEQDIVPYLQSYGDYYPNFKFRYEKIEESLLFYYEHPLNSPRIFPRLDIISKEKNNIYAEGDNILLFGMLEGNAKVKGKKVVYDPQSPVHPTPFAETGSEAEELTIIMNWGEAKALSKKENLNEIQEHFLVKENVEVLIIKMGAKGAYIFTKDGRESTVPVFKTKNVWSIGSGDVFSAIFSYWWFNGLDPVEAAKKASYSTAEYCNYKDFQFSKFGSNNSLSSLKIKEFPKGKIYLAAPFFTISQKWLIDQVKRAFIEMDLNIFSPLHDVGYGHSLDVAVKDLKAVDDSSLVFAILDGLDSGTIFEVGYAVSKKIPVVGFVQNESKDSLVMLEGTNCLLENDFTTAIYKSFWKLAENE